MDISRFRAKKALSQPVMRKFTVGLPADIDQRLLETATQDELNRRELVRLFTEIGVYKLQMRGLPALMEELEQLKAELVI